MEIDDRANHDDEDIILVMDNRSNIGEDVKESRSELKDFLKSEYAIIIENRQRVEILSVHLAPAP